MANFFQEGQNVKNQVNVKDPLKERQHEQANDFALELLMPKDSFDEYVAEVSCCVGDVAEHFQVTPLVARKRAEQLGYKFN